MVVLRARPVWVLVLAFILSPATALAGTSGGVLISGGRTTGEYWYGGHPQIEVDLSCGPRTLPLQLAAYAAGSRWSDNCNDLTCNSVNYKIGEAGVGLRAVWITRLAHISLGGGPAWGKYRVDFEGAEEYYPWDELRGMGWWTGGNALVRVGSHLGLGGGARYSRIQYDEYKMTMRFPLYAWSLHGSIGWLWPGGE